MILVARYPGYYFRVFAATEVLKVLVMAEMPKDQRYQN